MFFLFYKHRHRFVYGESKKIYKKRRAYLPTEDRENMEAFQTQAELC